MNNDATTLAMRVSQQPEPSPSETISTNAVQEAWKSQCSSLGEEEKKKFQSQACSNLTDYLDKIEVACQKQNDGSLALRVIDWFEPIYKVVELFTPAAAVAIQAYPNPGSLVLGGIVGLLQITDRLLKYQKLTTQMLAKMGRKARILLDYERDVYKDDIPVQKALIQVYGDILRFCQKAFRFLTNKGQLRARVKGFKLILFRDYESHLGMQVQDLEQHIEQVEDQASLCDRKRLKQLRDTQDIHHKEVGQLITVAHQHFQRQDDYLEKVWKRDQDRRERKDRLKAEQEQKRWLDWLSPLTFNVSYDQRCDEHLEGTGAWFLNSETYTNWKSGNNSDVLWVHGKPGCGKSVLAALTITDLKIEMLPEMALAYVFCRRDDEALQNPTSLLGALAKQTLQYHQDIKSILRSEVMSFQTRETPSQRTIRTVIRSALSSYTRTFLVIDALDECKHRRELALVLRNLVEDSPSSIVKVVVFSRYDFDIEERLKPSRRMQPDLGANEKDLTAYIRALFAGDSQASVTQQIREACITKADGMFLWVKLLAQSLQKPLNSKQKLKRIKDMPPGLGSVYDRIFNDIWEQDEDIRSTAFSILLWVTHAARPLNQSEMLGAVADYSEATRLKEAFDHTSPQHLVAICANLVVIDKDGRFRLCHESVRAYLDQTATRNTEPLAQYQQHQHKAHKRLAEVCLNYLLLKDWDCGPAKSVGRLRSLVKRCPFLLYAASRWGLHVTAEDAPDLRELILKVVLCRARRELSMQIFVYVSSDDSTFWDYSRSSNPLHLLSMFGLLETAKSMSDTAKLSQEADASGCTPLKYALIVKHREMSTWLIEIARNSKGLNLDMTQKIEVLHACACYGWTDVLEGLIDEVNEVVNLRMEPHGQTPLCGACYRGEMDAVRILVNAKADVNLQNRDGDTPLIIAVHFGHTSLVELLLEKGADPNGRDARGIFPLHAAAVIGDVKTTVALLKGGADPLATCPAADPLTPLHVAAAEQSVEVIRALHHVHPNLDMRLGNGDTALHVAAQYNSSMSTAVLLELGANKDEVDYEKSTPLICAAREGALETVEILLAAKCDMALTSSDGETAIHTAAEFGKYAVLRSLVNSQPVEKRQVLVNRRSLTNMTALHYAASEGCTRMVEFLLKNGADGRATTHHGWTPMHYASYYGHTPISLLLLKHTREPNPRDARAATPLHVAAVARKVDFVSRFFQDCLQLGLTVELNALDRYEQTALMAALFQGSDDVAKLLLEQGSISMPDIEGDYPIHIAATDGYDGTVQTLLTHDGVTSKGSRGRTPIFCAAEAGRLKTVKLLAPHSWEVLNTPDDAQRTSVMAALGLGHFEVAKYLLDIGVKHDGVDKDGRSLLHGVAEYDDAAMTRQLLKLGCKVDIMDCDGWTPLHIATEFDNIEVVNALIDGGSNAISRTTTSGINCIMLAAGRGNPEMVCRLVAHGARGGTLDLDGRTAAFYAAENGHWEVMSFLRDHGDDIALPDYKGLTPLTVAASRGYLDTVKYLLHCQKNAVHKGTRLEINLPLLKAAEHGFPLTIECLLAAGADPHHQDHTGCNALDYASRHGASLQEMHKAGHFHQPIDPIVQQHMLSEKIWSHCKHILRTSEESENSQRSCWVRELSAELLHIRDYSAAQICYMEITWPFKQHRFRSSAARFGCSICGSINFRDGVHICQSCHERVVLCRKCHAVYQEAGYIADLKRRVADLERRVQPVRMFVKRFWSLEHVSCIMNRFGNGNIWISATLNDYEVWEEESLAAGDDRLRPRPGQMFLKLVKAMFEVATENHKDLGPESEFHKRQAELSREYHRHRRNYRADKEVTEFICKGHEFLDVSAEERKIIMSVGRDLNPDTGRLTPAFLQGLLSKYKQSSETQTPKSYHAGDYGWGKLFRSVSVGNRTKFPHQRGADAQDVGQERHRARSLEQSLPAPTERPMRRHSGGSLGMPSDDSMTLPDSDETSETRDYTQTQGPGTGSELVIEPGELPIHGVDLDDKEPAIVDVEHSYEDEGTSPRSLDLTLPVAKETTPATPVPGYDNHDENFVAALSAVRYDVAAVEASGASSAKSVAAHAPSFEPVEIIRDHAGRSAVASTHLHDSTIILNINEDLRKLYAMCHGDRASDEEIALWGCALDVTEIMTPGFRDAYLRAKWDESEEAEADREAADENKGISRNSRDIAENDSDISGSSDYNSKDDEED